MNSTPSEPQEKKSKVIPFKLCFVSKREPGRSNIQIGKPLNLVPVVTQKFHVENRVQYDNIDSKIDELTTKCPKDKYEKPITQNQVYGWYEAKYLNDPVLEEIVSFRKCERQLIKEHLMTFEKIRDYV